MPTPGKNESQKDFVSRCIPIVMDEGTAKDNKQAAAICYSMWREHEKKKKGAVALSVTMTKAQRMSDGRIRWQARANSGQVDQQNERFDESFFDDIVANFWRVQEGLGKGQAVPGYAHPDGMPIPQLEVAHYSFYLPKSERARARVGWPTRMWRDGKALMMQGYFDESPMGKAAAEAVLADDDEKIKTSIGVWPDWDSISNDGETQVYKGGRGVAYSDHLALTTAPVDAETTIDAEVDPMAKSLTIADDALGVLNDPALVDELEKARLTGKSTAVPSGALIKADGDKDAPKESANAGAAAEVKPEPEKTEPVAESKVHVQETYTTTTTTDRTIEKDKAADTMEQAEAQAAAQAMAAQAGQGGGMMMSQAQSVEKSTAEKLDELAKALSELIPALTDRVDALAKSVEAMKAQSQTNEAQKVKAAIDNPNGGWLERLYSARRDTGNTVKSENAPKGPEQTAAGGSYAEALFNGPRK